MREEKPDVQGKCHTERKWKILCEEKFSLLWELNLGHSTPNASTVPLHHHHCHKDEVIMDKL